MAGMEGVRLESASIREEDKSDGIEPEIPKSRSGHNGWIPVNLSSLVLNYTAELNCQSAMENFLAQSEAEKLGTDQNNSKKRKSRADVAQGIEGIEVETPKRKPRKIKQEPVDFRSPMIQ